MLDKICSRMFLPQNNVVKYLIRFRVVPAVSHRSIATNKPLLKEHRNSLKVYEGVLSKQIRAVKAFSLTSSAIGLLCQPMLYKQIGTGSVPMLVTAYSLVGFFTFVTPLLLHVITKKYVISLEYIADEDKYIAYLINFFCITRKVEFKVDDVEVPELPGMFTTLKAKGKPLFFDPSQFEYPQHYAILMGYDKPMDFKMSEPSNSEKDESVKMK